MIELPAKMMFLDGDGPVTGAVKAEPTDANEVAVHIIPDDYTDAQPTNAYLSAPVAAALGTQLLLASEACLRARGGDKALGAPSLVKGEGE